MSVSFLYWLSFFSVFIEKLVVIEQTVYCVTIMSVCHI